MKPTATANEGFGVLHQGDASVRRDQTQANEWPVHSRSGDTTMLSTTTLTASHADAPVRQHGARHPGLFARILASLMAAREAEARRIIARYLANTKHTPLPRPANR